MAGVNAGADIAYAGISFKNRIVHGKDHAAGSGGLHDAQICEILRGQNRILKFFKGVSCPCRDANCLF